jgi:hypothetical protein
MYLSTLRSYVQAIGGELDLVVRLPKRPALRLQNLSDAFKTGLWIAGDAADKCRKTNDESPLKADAVKCARSLTSSCRLAGTSERMCADFSF